MKKFAESRDAIHAGVLELTHDTLEHAIGWIDGKFGKDYAKGHPELLASFVSAAMIGYAGSVIAAAIQDSRGRE